MREFSERRVYEFEDFRLDADSLLLFHRGEQLPLTPKVVATLRALVARNGEVVTKDELMETVWPDTQVEDGNLTQNLYILRKTLGTAMNGQPFIETLRRRGYRFAADVTIVRNGAARIETPSVVVERNENIYSVVDWQNQRKEQPAEANPVKRWMYPVAGLALIAVAAIILAIVFRTSPATASLNAGEITFDQLTDGRNVSSATISPNGDYFTYHETDGEVSRMFVQQVGQSNRTEIIPATRMSIHSKTFSPDGQSIYFVALEPGAKVTTLYRIPTLGGVSTKVSEDIGTTVAVSPDGSRIAYARSAADASHTEITMANVDGSAKHVIYTGKSPSIIWGGLGWSPDGRTIAFGEVDMENANAEGRCTISAIDVPTRTVRQLSAEKWEGCARMEFTFDGKALVFIGTRAGDGLTTRRDQLYYLSLDTGEARRLSNDGNRHDVSSLGVTRGGTILVVPLNRSSQLWTMNANGKSATAVQITTGQGDGRAGIAPLPDGRIGYIAKLRDSIGVWIANADGSNARQIVAEPEQIEEIRASADGKRFYFSSRVDRKPRLFSTTVDGTDLRRALEDETFDVDSSLSPDGNWIAYTSSLSEGAVTKRTVRLSPIAGGGVVQLTHEVAAIPNFSPDGRYVSFVNDQDEIGVVTTEGKPIAKFKSQPVPALNIGARWTPDGTALVYISRQKLVANLWLQPLDGSPPRQLTDFTSGEIYNFAFTTDGKKLIIARGTPTRNAMLAKVERN